MATCGLSAPPPNATSCGGVGARRWWTKRWASRSPEYWSAISTPPTTIMHLSGAGPTCCGTSTTSAPSTPMLRQARWADAVHGIYDRAKAFTHPQAKLRRTAQLTTTAGPRPALPARPVGNPGQADASSATSKNSSSSPNPQCLQTTTPPNAACAIWSSAGGGTRSEQGTESKMTLASLFGTWTRQGLNPLGLPSAKIIA